MFDRMPVTALEAVGKIAEMSTALRADSLAEFTRTTRVEPVTLVDQSLVTLPFIQDALQTLNSMYAAYYMMAVSLSVNVGNINVQKLLDSLNPNRDVISNASLLIGNAVGTESIALSLPVPGQSVGLEAYGPVEGMNGGAPRAGDVANQVANLSVGKLLNVELESNGHKVSIPVAIRLIVSEITPKALVHTLSVGSTDMSVMGRYHAWREGSIKFIRDGIFCLDRMEEHRRNLIGDKSGVYKESVTRKNKNVLSALLSGAPSLATASNLVVMSAETAKQLEAAVNGRLTDFKTREKIFKETYLMLMMVIDPQWEQVTIYTRGLDDASELSVYDMKGASKGNDGVDITKLLKSLIDGRAPVL